MLDVLKVVGAVLGAVGGGVGLWAKWSTDRANRQLQRDLQSERLQHEALQKERELERDLVQRGARAYRRCIQSRFENRDDLQALQGLVSEFQMSASSDAIRDQFLELVGDMARFDIEFWHQINAPPFEALDFEEQDQVLHDWFNRVAKFEEQCRIHRSVVQ